MKPIIKINFVDFWPGFNKTDNYFYKLLSENYNIVIDIDPEILFYSSYGADYLQYKCLRVFYSAENMRPDFTGCDYAITFDYMNNQRHYRLPLYALYIDQTGKLGDLLKVKAREQALELWKSKTKFCCVVVSNGLAKKRNLFFHALSAFKQVDSGGKWLNNVGGPVKDKLEFIKDYKFVLAFENSSSPGYTTEKILDPLLVDSIPVYWGNKLVGKDFNKNCFLNMDDYHSATDLIHEMLAIEKDPEKAIQMIMEPKFPGNQVPAAIAPENISAFLDKVIASKKKIVPVAISYKRILHFIKRKSGTLSFFIKKYTKNNFR